MTTNSINTAQVSGLVLYQVSAIFLYAVGLGSEASKPGLGLAGWETASGDGQFNSNGVPIHPDQIKENSGYTAGNLQWDFGQRHNGDWAAGYQAFINTFSLSPEWNALTADQQNQILTSLPMNGDTLKTSAANMLNQVEFDELDAFLKTPLGIDAAADLDQTNILVTSAKGLDSANIVAANGGDEAAQTMAAVVGLKLFNQGGIKAYNAFEQDLQDQTIKTADDIQTWVSDNYTPKSAIGTGISNALAADSVYNSLAVAAAFCLSSIVAVVARDMVTPEGSEAPGTEGARLAPLTWGVGNNQISDGQKSSSKARGDPPGV